MPLLPLRLLDQPKDWLDAPENQAYFAEFAVWVANDLRNEDSPTAGVPAIDGKGRLAVASRLDLAGGAVEVLWRLEPSGRVTIVLIRNLPA